MSGVQNGTRLDRLYALHLRTRHEIASAVRREAAHELARLRTLTSRVGEQIVFEGGTVPKPGRLAPARPRTKRKKAEDRVTKRLEQLGVSISEVRVWANAAGHSAGSRGRIKGAIVEAYATAHAHPEGGAA